MSKVVNKIEDLEGEVWKPVVGYEGYYEVSNLGRVKSLSKTWFTGKDGCVKKYKPDTILVNTISSQYFKVLLQKNKTRKNKLVHRLVAEAFIQNLENKPCVNHKNGIKTDNRAENLEWVTYRDNIINALENGLTPIYRGKNHPLYGRVGPAAKTVYCIETGKTWSSAKEAAKDLGIPHSTLRGWLNGNYDNKSTLCYA